MTEDPHGATSLDTVLDQRFFESSTQDDDATSPDDSIVHEKQNVVDKLRSGEYRVIYGNPLNKKFKSSIWTRFGRIFNKYTPLPYVCCKECKYVYQYSSRIGTSGILKHRCSRLFINNPQDNADGVVDQDDQYQHLQFHTGHMDLSLPNKNTRAARHKKSRSPVPEITRTKKACVMNNSHDRVKSQLEIKRLEVEIEYFRCLTKKTHEEIKKIQLEQMKLQRELGVVELIEPGASDDDLGMRLQQHHHGSHGR